MEPHSEIRHPWNVTPAEAREIQERLRHRIRLQNGFGDIRTVAGVDAGFEDAGRITLAAVAVLCFPDLHLLDAAVVRRKTTLPYIPGLLSFREAPAILDALDELDRRPDILLCDGQGIAHPRRFGLACHIGLLADLPAIGVAKKRLTGRHEPLPREKGSRVALQDGGEIIGAVLRTRAGVKPLYISPGHKIDLETAVRIVLACVTRYRLPETTRSAHRLASRPAAP